MEEGMLAGIATLWNSSWGSFAFSAVLLGAAYGGFKRAEALKFCATPEGCLWAILALGCGIGAAVFGLRGLWLL